MLTGGKPVAVAINTAAPDLVQLVGPVDEYVQKKPQDNNVTFYAISAECGS